jgi:hypothetical protein
LGHIEQFSQVGEVSLDAFIGRNLSLEGGTLLENSLGFLVVAPKVFGG